MGRWPLILCPVLVSGVVWVEPARAHKVKVFATAEGATITGYAYFPGGGKVRGKPVAVVGPNGRSLGQTRTNRDGEFTFTAKFACDHKFVVETGDGHRAEYTVAAEELGEGLQQAPSAEPQASRAAADEPRKPEASHRPPGADKPAAAVSDHALARMIEKAVSKQTARLRRDIERYQEQIRFRDVLGGIGYIFGIMAIILYFKRKGRPEA